MPDSRRGRAWFPMLVALLALLAFAPQAGATDEVDESDDPVVGCVAHDSEFEDSCSEDEPDADEPVGCVSNEDACSDDEPADEPDEDVDEHESGDDVRSCDEGPVARGANGSEHAEQFEDGCLPAFGRRFISRVWKFVGEVDYYGEGLLSMTLGKILNVPRKWRTQDDELLDQDTTVLVSERVRVFKDGERVGREALDEANDARVHGKLLRPFRWLDDEDGEAVPTVRAKKIYITG